MLRNATCTAVIDNINDRISIACKTRHNEVCDPNWIAATTTMVAIIVIVAAILVLLFEGYTLKEQNMNLSLSVAIFCQWQLG